MHIVIMMRYLISHVWREQNTTIDVNLFENASDDMGPKTNRKKVSNDRQMKKSNLHRKGKICSAC